MPENARLVLELDRVTRRFGDVTAVDRLSESFAKGEYFCILGPSGCGKTTLLRLIAGFDAPDDGAIRLHGGDVARVPPERRDVNVVFQSYALFPHMTVAENIGFGLRMKRLPAAESRTRVLAAIRLVHLEAEADRLPRQLSGGQQQRVALARALVNRPAVLLLDEPLSALDQALRARMQEELRRVQRETGVTFIHITHDQSEALSLADRVAVMRTGRFLQVGSPRDVYLRPTSRFVAAFVGATNLIPARIDNSEIALAHDGSRWRIRSRTDQPEGARGDTRGEVVLAVRPEAIRLAAIDDAHPDVPRGVVRQVAFAGADLECVIALSTELTLRARLPATDAAHLVEGDEVAVLVRPEDVSLLPADDA